MRLTILSSELLSRLNAVVKGVNPKTQIPILENFLFNIEEDKLTIIATDLETTLTTVVPLEHKSQKMSLAFPTKIMDVLKEMPDQLLHFDIDEKTYAIGLTTDNGSYNGKFLGINVGENGEDFPRAKEMSEDIKTFELTSEILLNGISKTHFAAAEEDSRPTMTGILFDIFEDKITFVATDAHELVKYSVLNMKNEFEDSFILPRKPAQNLKNLLSRTNDKVIVSFDERNILFEFSEYSMRCRKIEGRFPNYNSVIQQNNPYKAIVDRVSILKAIKRVSVFANESTELLKLKFTENQLLISAQDIDFSTSAEETLACNYSGEELEMGFKAKLLDELLSNISSTEVQFELADSSKAGIIVPTESVENEELLMLLMPMFIA
jgi:DNA polymerase-3 subunit beta